MRVASDMRGRPLLQARFWLLLSCCTPHPARNILTKERALGLKRLTCVDSQPTSREIAHELGSRGRNWKQFTGKVKEQWGNLTDDDLTQIDGNREQLEGKIQARYGRAKDQVKKEVDDWLSRS